ncbi:aldehyde ferredoxin oxidoreductase family protein [Candidatus Bipolaricaulota bacterium]|nr:aldehyde ferredoxin oxidoreductase family protein [Candidatus Bipolaricaulota bacterium]
MSGSFGVYLDVDLSRARISEYAIPDEWRRLYLGGRGIGARILLEELPLGSVDAMSAENILLFGTGPFQGTGLAGAGRHVVMGVSPKTKSVADAYAGGYFGHALGRSGFDGVILRGVSDEPVCLVVDGGEARLEPADDLWGMGTGETEQALLARYPGSRVTSIGPAGENAVWSACLINDRSRAAGRPGFGAVMGAKRVKAVVVRGAVVRPLHDAARFGEERAAYARRYVTEGYQGFGKYGTAGGVTWLSEQGILPTRNFQQGTFSGADAICGQTMFETILSGRETCAGCPIRCKRQVTGMFNGNAIRPEFGGPEYETVGALGSLCLVSDLEAIAYGNQLCNDLGLDTISAGVSIAFLMEASEKGMIPERIDWGDGAAMVRLIGEMSTKTGVGARLAEGVDALAKSIGADFAMTVKSVEIPMHEPRGKQGLGLSYAVSHRGANHMETIHDTSLAGDEPTPELGVVRPYDRFSLADKPAVIKLYEDLRSFDNSLIVCAFTMSATGAGYNYPAARSLLEAATGLECSPEEMLRIGERNLALLRLHSRRSGGSRDDHGLPRRFSEPLEEGASANHPIDPAEMQRAIDRYYELRGYDRLGPTETRLIALGMDECLDLGD